MPTILFPTDFSDAAKQAYIYALKMAEKLNARIVTLHAFERPDFRGLTHVPRDLEEFYTNADLYEFDNYRQAVPVLDRIQKENGLEGVAVVHTLHEGKTEPTIRARAAAEAADLIVMGTTGARGLKEIVLGSVAGEILENAPCPVLAVPEEAVFDGAIDKIAFTTNYLPEERAALAELLKLFAPLNVDVHTVNVDLAHTAEYHGRMDEFAAATPAEYAERMHYHVLDGTDFESTLTDFLEDNGVDILAMVTRRRNFLQELFHYSKTKAMSYHSRIPVLSFPVEK